MYVRYVKKKNLGQHFVSELLGTCTCRSKIGHLQLIYLVRRVHVNGHHLYDQSEA